MSDNSEGLCAVCREWKSLPLRNDDMGGYVCLTCVDKQLSRFHRCIQSADRELAPLFDHDEVWPQVTRQELVNELEKRVRKALQSIRDSKIQ